MYRANSNSTRQCCTGDDKGQVYSGRLYSLLECGCKPHTGCFNVNVHACYVTILTASHPFRFDQHALQSNSSMTVKTNQSQLICGQLPVKPLIISSTVLQPYLVRIFTPTDFGSNYIYIVGNVITACVLQSTYSTKPTKL